MPRTKKKKDLSQQVMKQIQKEKVRMKPRFYFVAGSILLGIGLAGAIVGAILFLNLTFFRMRIHGPLGFLWFGQFGLRPFLVTFPWLPLLIAVGGIFGGISLLRRYDISYKKSFLGLVIALLVLVLTMGFVLDQIGFNERLERIKPLHPFYPGHFKNQDWVMGEIIQIEDEEMVISTPQGEEVRILREEKTLLPFGGDFEVGERIRGVGEWRDDVFVAKGIGKGGLHWRMGPGMEGVKERKMLPRL
ncbi:hypothetical protein AMJ51_00550 [Microgenomates bacterium DG_75]|nr:MAG: hypothetical protein AMJ51_00550 [Microgenomates bacterium DG_75]